MSRKIYLSFLGTNDYVECNYYDETQPDKRVNAAKYVQEALLQMYCRHFTENDVYYFFLTSLARKTNWENNGQWNPATKQYDKSNKGLSARLHELGLKGEIHDITIPEGFSTDEIWQIFETVFHCIQEGDEVYFDITHAFRSLPLLGLALTNYARALKKININAIYYGAFEKLGPAAEVRTMQLEQRNAPVLDLLSVAELQEWTSASFDFIQYGKVQRLVSMTKDRIQPILTKTLGEDKIAKYLSGISKIAENMSMSIATNRGSEIYGKIKFNFLKDLLDSFAKSENYIKPLGAIIQVLTEKVATFSDNDPLHWLKSAKWCFQHEMYQESITQLQEGVLTWFCLRLSQQDSFFDWKNEEPRNLISSVFYIIQKNIPSEKWTGEAGKYKELTSSLINDELIKKTAATYCQITDFRNDINHGGYKSNSTSAAKIIQKCEQFIEDIERLLVNNDHSVQIQPDAKQQGLLNLSNHPSPAWPAEQQQAAAAQFGPGITDLPFPQIAPEADEQAIEQLAGEYHQQIMAMQPLPAAVHLMGEMTFTFALVKKLQASGIRCVASTTARDVVEEGGVKVSKFRFVRFRNYMG